MNGNRATYPVKITVIRAIPHRPKTGSAGRSDQGFSRVRLISPIWSFISHVQLVEATDGTTIQGNSAKVR